MIGRLIPSSCLIVRIEVGEAKNDSHEYELSHMPGGQPVITNIETGMHYTIGWQELIQLATDAGINEPEKRT